MVLLFAHDQVIVAVITYQKSYNMMPHNFPNVLQIAEFPDQKLSNKSFYNLISLQQCHLQNSGIYYEN